MNDAPLNGGNGCWEGGPQRNNYAMYKRILIIQLHHLFGIHPLHHSFIQMLMNEGCEIDVLFADYPESEGNLGQYNLHLHRVDFPHGKKLLPFVVSMAKVFYRISLLLFYNKYDCIVAVEPQALIVISPLLIIRRLLKKRFIYFSLEIIISNELKKPAWKVYKRIEAWLSRRVDMVITQDEWRARLLSRENKLDIHRVKEFPNTIYGSAEYSKSYYLHEMLKINKEKKIVLCLGTPAFMSTFITDLVNSDFSGWPEDWVLVIHSGIGENLRVGKKERDIIYYTDSSLPFRDVELLYRSADIGLAIYREYDGPTGGENLDSVGHSSGKFNLFLKYGKPVITTNQYTFVAISKQNNCCIPIQSFEQIPDAIKSISSAYREFSNEAIEYYNKHLKIELYTSQIISEMF